MSADAIENLLRMAKDDLLQDVDGFYYYFPGTAGGSLSPWMLRAIADELDRLNAPYQAQIDAYFDEKDKEYGATSNFSSDKGPQSL